MYVYVLQCLDLSYYVGMTSIPIVRLQAHMAGKGAAWTKRHGVRELLLLEPCKNKKEAEMRERELTITFACKGRRTTGSVWAQAGLSFDDLLAIDQYVALNGTFKGPRQKLAKACALRPDERARLTKLKNPPVPERLLFKPAKAGS